MNSNEAQKLADKFVAEFKPHCKQIAIAGSLRRGKTDVHDIDIVIIPKLEVDLFHNEVEGQYTINRSLFSLKQNKTLLPATKDGLKYKQFPIAGTKMTLDIFIANELNFGLILAIRTGGRITSRRIVTKKRFGGWLPDQHQVTDGFLWLNGEIVPVPDERKFFENILGGWLPPEKRP